MNISRENILAAERQLKAFRPNDGTKCNKCGKILNNSEHNTILTASADDLKEFMVAIGFNNVRDASVDSIVKFLVSHDYAFICKRY